MSSLMFEIPVDQAVVWDRGGYGVGDLVLELAYLARYEVKQVLV